MQHVVIVAAARTATGNLNGSLANVPAHELGAAVISEALRRANVAPQDVSEVILGQVLTAGTGQGSARQASIAAGLPIDVPAWSINQVCASGLRSVALGYQAILNGDSAIVVAGGQESMSLAPHCIHMRNGIKMGPGQLVDTMTNEGIRDVFNNYPMGNTAENVAKKYNIGREQQDQFALESQQKAAKAQRDGKLDAEIRPILVKQGRKEFTFDKDEFIRPETTLEALAKLRPAFSSDGGTVTAGNSSGINDGAGAVVLMTEAEAKKRGLEPLARIASWAQAGVDPSVMGIGPVPASQRALEKAGWKVQDLDVVEANEAFAAQACAVNQLMGWDPAKVNVNGGAIALGHPIGASGVRILNTLLHEMKRRGSAKGLATLCIGGGMGVALCVER